MRSPANKLLIAFVILIVANLPALRQVFSPSPLEADSDTRAILEAMRQTGGWAGWTRWLQGDWFLQNGFYRPVTCLSLLLDYQIYGETAWGYRLTNWLLAVSAALGCYAVVRCLSQRWLNPSGSPWQAHLFSLAVALAFSLQQSDALQAFQSLSAWWLLVAAMAVYFWASRADYATLQRISWRRDGWQLWLGAGAFFWGWNRLVFNDFERLMVWVPSRTALLSTALGIWSFYSVWQWAERRQIRYLIATALLYAGAVGAYEQPLTLTPLVVILATAMRGKWGWHGWVGAAVFASIAIGYLALRWYLLPLEPSDYQQQQLRSSVKLALLHWTSHLIPIVPHLQYWRIVGPDPYLLFSGEAWNTLVADLAFIGVATAAWRHWKWVGWWLLWQGVTTLPMSLLHPFEHYYYLPQTAPNAVDCLLMWWGWSHVRQTLQLFEHR